MEKLVTQAIEQLQVAHGLPGPVAVSETHAEVHSQTQPNQAEQHTVGLDNPEAISGLVIGSILLVAFAYGAHRNRYNQSSRPPATRQFEGPRSVEDLSPFKYND